MKPTDQSLIALKPCPCCGASAHFFKITDVDQRDYGGEGICCSSNLCGLTTDLMFSLMDSCKPILAERWNRRAAALTREQEAGEDDRSAFARYLKDCDDCAIVPDVAGAFNWAWHAREQEAPEKVCNCGPTCEDKRDGCRYAREQEAQPANAWQPIETANKYDDPVWLHDPTLIDADANPTGTFDGHWQDDEGWMAAVWSMYTDEWHTQVINPTHWCVRTIPSSDAAQSAPKEYPCIGGCWFNNGEPCGQCPASRTVLAALAAQEAQPAPLLTEFLSEAEKAGVTHLKFPEEAQPAPDTKYGTEQYMRGFNDATAQGRATQPAAQGPSKFSEAHSIILAMHRDIIDYGSPQAVSKRWATEFLRECEGSKAASQPPSAQEQRAEPKEPSTVQEIMFMVYDYAKISDGIDATMGDARETQRKAMAAKADEIRAVLGTALIATANEVGKEPTP